MSNSQVITSKGKFQSQVITSKGKLQSQVITCKAAVCWGKGEEVKVEEIQVEPPKSSEVRVKMLYASLCHTDVLLCQSGRRNLFPLAVGHEGVGIIESVGEDVREEHVRVGDLVIPTYIGECKECANCKSGKTNLCHKYPPVARSGLMKDGTSRLSIKGQKLYHIFSCATLAEYSVVDVNYIVKVDSRTALSHASFISCGFSTGFGGAWKEAKVEKGSSVAVLGLGAVGLGAIEGARMQGAARIIGVDINERKRETAVAFGMTDFINPAAARPSDGGEDSSGTGDSISVLVNNLTGGLGVDYCFECTGVASLASEALQATKIGLGTTIVLGAGTQPIMSIHFAHLRSGRTIKGSAFGGIKVQSDIPAIVEKCINKEIKLDELLTHEVSLEDIHKAFEFLKQPDCIKVLIKI